MQASNQIFQDFLAAHPDAANRRATIAELEGSGDKEQEGDIEEQETEESEEDSG
jgi:hypothetical protein